MQDFYVYPAIFGYEDENKQVGVYFPDIPGCTAQGTGYAEAIEQAQGALSLHLWSMEEDGDYIPAPSRIQDIKTEDDEFVTIIKVFMPAYRQVMDSHAENRTVTLPHWLNKAAKSAGVNFSQLLQEAIIQKLGISSNFMSERQSA